MTSKLQTKKDACRRWLMKILYFLCAESHTGGGPKRIAVRPVKGIIKKLNYMMKKKIFMPLLGAVVLGMSAYAGYRTYDAYNGVSESDLLLANAEALADDESPKHRVCYWESKVRIGYTYYDCGSCDKIYDEQGKGSISKCFPD